MDDFFEFEFDDEECMDVFDELAITMEKALSYVRMARELVTRMPEDSSILSSTEERLAVCDAALVVHSQAVRWAQERYYEEDA